MLTISSAKRAGGKAGPRCCAARSRAPHTHTRGSDGSSTAEAARQSRETNHETPSQPATGPPNPTTTSSHMRIRIRIRIRICIRIRIRIRSRSRIRFSATPPNRANPRRAPQYTPQCTAAAAVRACPPPPVCCWPLRAPPAARRRRRPPRSSRGGRASWGGLIGR